MQLLDSANVATLTEMILEDVPRALLEQVSHAPRISEGALVGMILDMLPSTIETERVRWHCQDCLWWLVNYGDLVTSGTRRYVIVPTYGVLLSADGRATVRLQGDIQGDQTLRQQLGQKGINLKTRSATLTRQGRQINVGFLRSIEVLTEQLGDLRIILEGEGIPVIDPDVLQTRLPVVDNATIPPSSTFQVTPPHWGLWDQYSPERRSDDRWVPTADVDPMLSSGLFRWRLSDDWRGEQNARYFLAAGRPVLGELDQNYAALWMLHSDQQAANPRPSWHVGRTLWVPLMVPAAYHQWLRLLSERWRCCVGLARYDLFWDAADTASLLQENLRMRRVEAKPAAWHGGCDEA